MRQVNAMVVELPRPRHREADPQAITDFKQQWPERLAKACSVRR
jgi:hypothetical protein